MDKRRENEGTENSHGRSLVLKISEPETANAIQQIFVLLVAPRKEMLYFNDNGKLVSQDCSAWSVPW